MSDSFMTPWTVADQAPLSMDFSGKSPGVDCRFLLQGIFLTPGIEPGYPTLQADSLLPEPPGKPVRSQRPLPDVSEGTS